MAGSILAMFAVQSLRGDVDGWNERFGLHPQAIFAGRDLPGLLTALWSHASWTHAGLNAVFALAFGAPVARLFGRGMRGSALFAIFYLIGGVLASLGFALAHIHGDVVLVGASGAVSALTGGAARLIGVNLSGAEAGGVANRPGAVRLAPFTSAPVLGMTFAFVVSNLVLGLVGLNVGQGDAPLAWEAHLAGYAAGLVLIAPFARIAGKWRGNPVG